MLYEESVGQGLDTFRRGVGVEKGLGLSLNFLRDLFNRGTEPRLTLLRAGTLLKKTEKTEKFVTVTNKRVRDLDGVRTEGS